MRVLSTACALRPTGRQPSMQVLSTVLHVPPSPPLVPSLEGEPTPINSTSELPGIYGTSVDSFEDGLNSTVDLPDGISFASVAPPLLVIRSEDAARVSSGVSFAITAPDEISSSEISSKGSRKPHRVSAASELPILGKSAPKPKRQVSSNMVVGIILQVRSPSIVIDCLPHHSNRASLMASDGR